MRIAVEKEGAPSWYRAAMAGVIDQKGQRDASIRYLEEELQKRFESSSQRHHGREITTYSSTRWEQRVSATEIG